MNTTETKLQYEICESGEQGIPVIIVAAGASSRMQGENKQFIELNGVPVVVRSLLAFENCPLIKNIILVTRKRIFFLFNIWRKSILSTN